MTNPALTPMEQLKLDSRFLRGTLTDSLSNPITGAISEDDTKLLKFHGSYQQDDRDLRDERRKQKLEPAYSFMIRARLPGGVVSPTQWLAFDDIARQFASRGLRITTRQTFQWHGIIKRNLKPTLQAIDRALATTIAACGDVNRQVVSSVNPWTSTAHAEIAQWARRISDHFLPRTRAYHEIWLDGEKVVDSNDEEPLYGPTYLPRKFKIGIAVPPVNDIDVFAQDVGLIAIIENGQLSGFNLTIGGGMGATHGDASTYPRVSSVIGFITPEQTLAAIEAVMTLQRDLGNRVERQHARLKYTIDRVGLQAFAEQVEERAALKLTEPRPWHFDHNGDRLGWYQGDDGLWHVGLSVESGRLWDQDSNLWQQGIREIAAVHKGTFLLTCNQNLVIAGIDQADRPHIEALIDRYALDIGTLQSGIRRHSVACVALPTCGLAMAESERYLPLLLPKLETLLERHGLRDEPITLRLSGCPNGCSRPYLAEIALVGRAPGRYDLRLGAAFSGDRLNEPWLENVTEDEILQGLDTLFQRYATERLDREHFGDFLIRKQIVVPRLSAVIRLKVETITAKA